MTTSPSTPKSRNPIARLALIIFVLLLAAGGLWQAGYYWWYHGYSEGTRTGVVRKLSTKGPPVCKYFSGELVMQGSSPIQPAEIWEFSLDNGAESDPIYQQLKAAEHEGSRVTVHYRQDRRFWWRCTSIEYFVTRVEK